MQRNKPLYMILLFATCRSISFFFASFTYFFIKIGLIKTPGYVIKYPDKKFKFLHCIWYARITRRLVSFLSRTPVKKDVLKMIYFNIPVPENTGCIIATCHSPWKRILSYWCFEKKFGLIVGGGKWFGRRQFIQTKGGGITELRKLIKHLMQGGRVITNVDFFKDYFNSQVKFLNNDYKVSLFTERLAKLSKVPVITLIPKLRNSTIEFTAGPQFSENESESKSTSITSRIIAFFESQIEVNPSIWSYYVR